MKIILAPDSYKGSLTSPEVCRAMAAGIKRVVPDAEVVAVPIADGGEGTVQALITATGGRLLRKRVTGPLGNPVEAFFGILGDGKTAVIEMATASGLPLVPADKRDPRTTTTHGTGELIRAALDAGCTRLIIGIGGSATNDGGAGMARALGYRFWDSENHDLPLGGAALIRLKHIDSSGKDPRLDKTEVMVACDVTNPLVGATGASAVFGPQKGATPEMVIELDQALTHFAAVIEQELGRSIANLPGAGAAGGLGGGLAVFLHADLRPGIEIVIEAAKLEEKLTGAHLVITGEGCIDGQTIMGKAPVGVAKAAKKRGIPVLAVAGSLGPGAERVYQHGIDGVVSIIDRPMPLKEALANAANLVAGATERMLRIYLINRKL